MLKCFPGSVDVLVVGSSQAADLNVAIAKRCCNLANGLEVAWRRDRKAGFDDVHAEIDEGLSDLQFLLEIHAAARRLLAVTQRRVKDPDLPFVTHVIRCLESQTFLSVRVGGNDLNYMLSLWFETQKGVGALPMNRALI